MIKARSLKGKGLIIVSLPVVLSLVTTVILVCLLREAETQLRREAFAARVMALSTRLQSLYYEAVYDGYIYHITRSERMHERSKKCTKEIPAAQKELARLLSEDDQQRRLVKDASATGGDILKILHEVQTGAPWELGGALDAKLFRREVFHKMHAVIDQYQVINDYAKVIEASAPRLSQQNRVMIFAAAIAGIVASVLLAISLSVFFTRSITGRLDTITDNTLRLARDAPLNPPLVGKDEIAELDRVFHDMTFLLEDSARKEKALVENAVNVLASLDENLKFIEVSPASQSVWGVAPEELVGTRVVALLRNPESEEVGNLLKSLIESRGREAFDASMTHRDGRTIDVRWDVHWAESEKALFCVATDITKEKQLARFKQELIDMVAHDLRTPVSSIRGTLNLITMGVLGEVPEKVKSRVSKAEAQSDRLIRLINDLLDFERLESGQMVLNRKSTEAELIVDQSVEAVSGLLSTNSLTINRQVADLEVDVDPDRVIQVLVNLLSNAVKFSPANGSIDVRVSAEGDLARIEVSDCGPGIPDELKEKIFERFRMIEERSQGKSGSGLGLAISREIVEMHGGTIGVENNSDRGCTFAFTVPVAG